MIRALHAERLPARAWRRSVQALQTSGTPPKTEYSRTNMAADRESELLQRVAAGDRSAVRSLFDSIGPQALALATKVTGNRDLGEEAVQEAFVDAWRKAETFDARRGRARQWVLMLVHHTAVDVVRRERGATQLAGDAPLPSPPENPEYLGWMSDRRALVLEAVQNLSPSQREAIMLAYFNGLSYREVAEHLGIPEGTAKSRLRDGLVTLRGLVETHGVEWGPA